nr:putative F-box and FNIP repeat-containing protein [Megavirus caiporensis]
MSIIDILNIDTIICILEYLEDYDKMSFIMTCKEYYGLRDCVNYTNLYEYNNVKDLPMLDRFKRLIYRGKIPNKKIPTIKTDFPVENLNKIIPNNTTHLKFEFNFNKDIKGYVPNSVTHLTFGYKFNQNVKYCIPNSVTNLTFGHNFNQDINECIPNGVSYLIFGKKFNQDIKDCIPNSVTHLIFNNEYNKNIKSWIPNTVTHLLFLN